MSERMIAVLDLFTRNRDPGRYGPKTRPLRAYSDRAIFRHYRVGREYPLRGCCSVPCAIGTAGGFVRDRFLNASTAGRWSAHKVWREEVLNLGQANVRQGNAPVLPVTILPVKVTFIDLHFYFEAEEDYVSFRLNGFFP